MAGAQTMADATPAADLGKPVSAERRFSQIEIAAMEVAAEPGWYPWIFVKKTDGVHCTGAVCPIKTRGPAKGQPNYRRHDPDTKRTVVVPFSG